MPACSTARTRWPTVMATSTRPSRRCGSRAPRRRQARRTGDGRGPGRGQGRRADRAEQRDRLRRQERRVPEAGRRDRCSGGRSQSRRRRRAEGRFDSGAGKTVEQAIADLSAKIGEKLELLRAAFFDGTVEAYLHKRAADLPLCVGCVLGRRNRAARMRRGKGAHANGTAQLLCSKASSVLRRCW